MTNWIEWHGGECPIKSDKTRVEYEQKNGMVGCQYGQHIRWSHINSVDDIIAYRIIEDHEPKMTREQIMAQIEALQKQLEDLPKTKRYFWFNGDLIYSRLKDATNYLDIEIIKGVPHIQGVAMKEVGK